MAERKKLGYIEGYELLNPIVAAGVVGSSPLLKDLSASLTHKDQGETNMPTESEQNFKYAIDTTTTLHDFEEPLFPYFLMMISENSPLLKKVENFINSYSVVTEITNRAFLYLEFKNQLKKFFYLGSDIATAFKAKDTAIKNFYIESIAGLDKLSEKMVKFKEDKITITLTEDVGLIAQYLAWSYNNLWYSYKTKRYVIPENLMRFDLNILIKDMRNFKNALNNYSNMSYYVYTLHDCNFDFFKSQDIPTELTTAGWGAINTQPAGLSFDIYYKSISRKIIPDILKAGIISDSEMVLYSNYAGIAGKSPDTATDAVSSDLVKDSPTNNAIYKTIKGTQDLGTSVNGTFTGAFLNNLTNDVESYLKFYEEQALRKVREIRGSLINNIIYEIKKVTPPDIYPSNVYTEGFEKSVYDQYQIQNAEDLKNLGNDFIQGLESTVLTDLEQGFQGGVNSLFGGIGL